MSKLIITGNGFDLAHGLRTNYSDFRDYLLSYEKEPEVIMGRFALLRSISEEDQNRHRFYEKLSKFIPEYELWNLFEDALGILDAEEVKGSNSSYYLGYGDDNWRDSANHDYQEMIGEDLDFASQVPVFLSEWIKSVSTKTEPIISQNVIMPNDLYLNFNYTDTLESTYGIPENRVLYIHGKALRGDTLIVGHHDNEYFSPKPTPRFESEEDYERYIDDIGSIDFREQEAEEKIKTYFRTTYKDSSKIISRNKGFFGTLSQVTDVYVLGHSLSMIDFEYFNEIKRQIPASCPWFVSWCTQNDYNKLLNLMGLLNVGKYSAITFNDILR